MKIFNLILVIIPLVFLSSCSDPVSEEYPNWIKTVITHFKSEPVGNPPQTIWMYTYENQKVYYIPPQCCDQYAVLYDSDGNIICAPDGGITGNGDGRCPDFFKERSDEKLIWRDERM